MTCPVFDQCSNTAQCYRCFHQHLYKPHKRQTPLAPKSLSRTPKKQGIKAEQDFVKQYKQTIQRADQVVRQQIASGALHHHPGDVETFDSFIASLYEIKEKLVDHTKGKKTFTIQKEWLDKLKKEARQLNKDHYALPFRFSEDNSFYVVIELEILLSLVETIRILSNHVENK